MDLLINDPPTTLEVDGIIYPIDYDYRNCLEIIKRCSDENLPGMWTIQLAIEWLFDVDLDEDSEHPFQNPDILYKAAIAAIDFLNCGNSDILHVTKHTDLMSLEHDSRLIRSAIETTHHIRLSQVKLHWWEFCYMLMDLSKDSYLMYVLGIRVRRAKGKLTQEDRDFIRDNPNVVNIRETVQDTRTALEKEAELIQKMGGGTISG